MPNIPRIKAVHATEFLLGIKSNNSLATTMFRIVHTPKPSLSMQEHPSHLSHQTTSSHHSSLHILRMHQQPSLKSPSYTKIQRPMTLFNKYQFLKLNVNTQ
ncbi:hypothetical protein Peur_052244 [Populus x canadensis]